MVYKTHDILYLETKKNRGVNELFIKLSEFPDILFILFQIFFFFFNQNHYNYKNKIKQKRTKTNKEIVPKLVYGFQS